MTYRRLRSLAGLAAAIVPCAIIVHLVAEAAAVGRDGLDAGFLARHGYLGGLFLVTAWWFGSTVGFGRRAAERRRRCALLQAELRTCRPQSLIVLIGANLAFFSLTQAGEGMPVLSGAAALGLGVALAGSLLAALVVFFLGGSLVAAGLDAIIGISPLPRPAVTFSRRDSAIAAPRNATAAFRLFVPNRPPPAVSHI